MTRLAAEQLGLGDKVRLDLELHREGRSFTSDTLEELKARYPDGELWLLMGTDMFLTFQAWHEPEKILSLAGIAAFGRTEEDTEELFAAQRDYLYQTYPQARLFTLTIPGVVDVSSTELREQLREGRGSHLLPPAVYGYILAGGAVRHRRGSEAAVPQPAAGGGTELPQAQAHPPRAGDGAGGHPPGGALRRGRGQGPDGGAAPRLHQKAGDGGTAGAVPPVRHPTGRAGTAGIEAAPCQDRRRHRQRGVRRG